MPPNMSPTFSLYLMSMIIILIHVPTSLCDDNQQYVACGRSFQCQGITANYPFWGGNRPEYCGRPEFQLNCQDNNPPILTIQTRTYRVLSIDNRTQTLTVAREEFWNSTCPTFLYNATLDTNLFNYGSNTQNLRLFYACPTLPFQGQAPIPYQFSCTLNGTTSVNYYYTSETVPSTSNLGTCNSHVVVPVFQSALQGLMVNPPSTTVSAALTGGFELQWTAEDNNNNCNQCVQSGGRCGYNSGSRSFTCYCSDQAYSLECNSTQNGNVARIKKSSTVIAATTVSIGLLLISVSICVLWRKKLRMKGRLEGNMQGMNSNSITEGVEQRDTELVSYNLPSILASTDNFSEANKLGEGGFGPVYKGSVPGFPIVAMKRLSKKSLQGTEEFMNELKLIAKLQHKNLVRILGYCFERDEKILIYEYMPNRSLDKFIFNPSEQTNLDWSNRFRIIEGITQGLLYLHKYSRLKVIHRDLKASNVLLDEAMNPKISDFGMARIVNINQTEANTNRVVGT